MEISQVQIPNQTPQGSTSRRLLLFVCVIIGIALVLFLVYQNGKSIYTHGI
jgi:hypothetical protein